MAETHTCRECGTPIPESAPGKGKYCPQCLLELAITIRTEHIVPDSPETGATLSAGEVFGSYELLEKIGEGGMGVVYKARQRVMNRMVALKMMRSGAFATPKETRRFRIEAEAAGQLQHPNVVAIHEVGEHKGQAFYSMDYIEGMSLAEVVRRTPLPADRAARYVQIIAEAMQYAHEEGILHRDLKPANVLLDTHDQPLITDFGLAKRVEAETVLTQTGAVLGTPSYMPPEQAAGKHETMTPASDVYSIGAILYDLLTGRPPFRADTPIDTLRQVLDAEPAPPRLLNRKVPRDLETICLKCLAKEPTKRYATAKELAEDLRRYFHKEPIRARPVGHFERLWRWGRREPALAGLAAGSGLLLIMLAVATAWQVSDAVHGNSVAAQLASRFIRLKLNSMEDQVVALARDPDLVAAIASGDQDAQTSLLKKFSEIGFEEGFKLANWMLLSTNGLVMARWEDWPARTNDNFSQRDYFLGAVRAAEGGSAHVSDVYESVIEPDPQKRQRFGIAVAIKDTDKEMKAILSAMVQLTSVEEAFAIEFAQRKLMIAGRYDPYVGTNSPTSQTDATNSKPFVLMMHPGLDRKDQVIRIEHRHLKAMVRSTDMEQTERTALFFRDPMRRHRLGYQGLWLASFVRVPGTTFVVICETRNRAAEAALTAGLIGGIVALALLSWRRARRGARSSEIVGN